MQKANRRDGPFLRSLAGKENRFILPLISTWGTQEKSTFFNDVQSPFLWIETSSGDPLEIRRRWTCQTIGISYAVGDAVCIILDVALFFFFDTASKHVPVNARGGNLGREKATYGEKYAVVGH